MRYKVIGTLLALWGIARFCHYQTDGFRLSKLQDNTSPFLDQFPLPLEREEKSHLDRLLNQPYTYLARGKQSFAFVSKDGTTVLKFFNNRNQRKVRWLRSKKAKQKLEATFRSYQIAADLLKNETGLLYFHPRKGVEEFSPVTIIDRLQIAHAVDINKHGFLLQKRAVLPYEYLGALDTIEQKKQAIEALISLLRTKMQRGIADHDPIIRANVGFDGNRPIQIDIGPFTHDPSLLSVENQKKALHKMTLSFKHWLEAHYPELTETLDEAIAW